MEIHLFIQLAAKSSAAKKDRQPFHESGKWIHLYLLRIAEHTANCFDHLFELRHLETKLFAS